MIIKIFTYTVSLYFTYSISNKQEMAMMKSKGSNLNRIKSESRFVMNRLCSEPFLYSFDGILTLNGMSARK